MAMWIVFGVGFLSTWYYMASRLNWWFFGLTDTTGTHRRNGNCLDCGETDSDNDDDETNFRIAGERQNLLRQNQQQNRTTYSSASSLAQEILCQICYAAQRSQIFAMPSSLLV